MQSRAYSIIEVKSFDETKRVIEGTATTPTPDRLKDIVNPLGAKFDLPLPFLWQHNHDEPIGHVIEADVKKSGISFKAQIEKAAEPGTLKDRLDEAWQSIKMKLVRAVSIGFNPLKWSFMDNGGIEFEEWEWFELSAVTIPANAEALINEIKSAHGEDGLIRAVRALDAEFRREHGVPDPEIPAPPEEAATGEKVRVVKLDAPARDRAKKPFVLRKIVRT